MAEQLKPCPFCGGEGRMNREADPDGFGYFIAIECRNCRARSRPKYYSNGNDCPQTYQECRDEWNTRPEAAQVRVKALDWDDDFAKTPWGGYSVGERLDSDDDWKWGWAHTSRGDWDESDDLYDTPKEAAKAAQADFDRRIRAALEPDTLTGWRDISTAPKDGTRVMLSYDDFVTTGRYWDAWNDGTADWFDDSDDVLCGYLEPTHWMPLPSAPEKEG